MVDVSGCPNHLTTERYMADQYPRQLFQDRLELKARQLNEEAETLPHGRRREALLHKAHQINTASQIVDKWLSSPGLRAPR
jgi:hypothetical protein